MSKQSVQQSDVQKKHLRSNSAIIVAAKLGSKLGDLLANTKTVLPWILSAAGAPTFFAAALAPIRESGALLPQVLISQLIGRFSRRKWFFCLGSLIQGLAIFGIGASSVFVDGERFGWLALALIAVFSLARALCSLSSKDVIGKMIPEKRRGRLGGISASASGALSIAAGLALSAGLLKQWADGGDTDGLRYILFAATLCWLIAAVFFALIHERKSELDKHDEDEKANKSDPIKPLRKFKNLLQEKSYRRFLIVRTLMISSSLALPYFIILSQDQDQQTLSALGMFIMLGGVANFISAWVWGHFSDQSSRRVMIISACMTSILLFSSVALLWADAGKNDWVLGGLFFLLSIIHAGVRLGRKTYILDIADDSNRLDYISVANTSIGIALLIMGLLTAFIASYSILLILLVFAVGSATAALMGKYLPEAN